MNETRLNGSIIDVTSLNEKVYNYIKQEIINLNYPPGHKLNVKQLSEILRVSNTPIKDALFRLTGEGLVETTTRTGTYVKSVTEADINEIVQTRLFLETAVVGEIAADITEGNLQVLRDLYQKSAFLTVHPNDTESYKAFMEYDTQFHLSFFVILGNKHILQIYKNLNVQIQIGRFLMMHHALGKLPTTDEEHLTILQALCEHSPEKAKQAVASHIRRVCTPMRVFQTVDPRFMDKQIE